MSTVLQPRSTGRDVISGYKTNSASVASIHMKRTLTALALNLDQHGAVFGILSVPGSEGGEQLETVALGVNLNLDAGTVLGRALEGILTRVVSTGRELEAGRRREFEGLARRSRDRVGQGVEGEGSGECESSDNVG